MESAENVLSYYQIESKVLWIGSCPFQGHYTVRKLGSLRSVTCGCLFSAAFDIAIPSLWEDLGKGYGIAIEAVSKVHFEPSSNLTH